MTIRRAKKTNNFTTIHNHVAQDQTLPLEAKGLWLDLISRPEDWRVLPKHLAKQYGIGKDKMYKILNKLIEAKLCRREQPKEESENGSRVFGNVEYVIYDCPEDWEEVEKRLPRPCFPDTENPHPENPYPENQDITKIDSTEEREEQQQPPPDPDEGPPDRSAPRVVVFLPHTKKIPGISHERLTSLIDEFDEDVVEDKAKLLLDAAVAPDNPYGWLRKAIVEDWQPKAEAEDRVPGNRKWAQETIDGRTLGPVRIEALNSHLEFVYTAGAKQPDCFDYGLAGFKDLVTAHYQGLKKRLEDG